MGGALQSRTCRALCASRGDSDGGPVRVVRVARDPAPAAAT